MTALLWCDKMYKNISKKLLHLTIEFFLFEKIGEKSLTFYIECHIIAFVARRERDKTKLSAMRP